MYQNNFLLLGHNKIASETMSAAEFIYKKQLSNFYVLDILKNDIIPASNVFCYGQVESRYGSGQFFKDLNTGFGKENDDVILSKIKNKEAILDSIKDFLGKGK